MSASVMHFDSILETYVGSGGVWQWSQFLLILMQNIATNVPFMLHIFSANTPSHRCLVPLCENATVSRYKDALIEFAIPFNEEGDSFLQTDQVRSKCQMRQQTNKEKGCVPESFVNASLENCDSFVYDDSVFQSTVVTEYNLVCEESYKKELIGTILMVGLSIGCIVGGPLGDKVGRSKGMVITLAILAPSVVIESFAPGYYMFLALRLIVFTGVGTLWVCVNSLILEIFGSHHRILAFSLNAAMFSLSGIILALIGYLERRWRYLHLWVGLLITATVPIIFFLLKESTRWLILNNKEEEAIKIMIKAGQVNKRNLDSSQREEMKSHIKIMSSSAKQSHESKLSVFQMFKPGFFRNTLVLMTIWVSCICSFYALALNVGSLAGDIFLNNAISNLADIPAPIFIFFTIDRIGRKNCIIMSQLVLGLSCLGMAFTPKDQDKIILCLYLLGKFSSSVSLNMVWFYTAELFPTNLRSQACASCSLVSRIFGTLSSFVPGLAVYWAPLPMIILGIPAVVSAALTMLLPETMGEELRDFAHEAKVDEETVVQEADQT